MQDQGYKRCSKCGKTKPRDQFNAHSDCRDGRRPECKVCLAIFQRAYRKANAERLKQRQAEYYERTKNTRNDAKRKPCRGCGGLKPPGDRRHFCSDECRAASIEATRERKNAANAEWYRRNADQLQANARRRRIEDPEFARQGDERSKQWIRDNPERAYHLRRMALLRYRARLAGAFIENVDHVIIYERDGGRCHICGDLIPLDVDYREPLAYQVDHVVPIVRGGEHSYKNTAASHRKCNRRKGKRLLSEMAA